MKNLIKKSEIGLILGYDKSYGWHLVKKYELKHGELKTFSVISDRPEGKQGRSDAIAYKAVDVGKILGSSGPKVIAAAHRIRLAADQCLELTIYQPKK